MLFLIFPPNSFTVGVLNAVLSVSALAGMLCPPPWSCLIVWSPVLSPSLPACSSPWSCLQSCLQLPGVYKVDFYSGGPPHGHRFFTILMPPKIPHRSGRSRSWNSPRIFAISSSGGPVGGLRSKRVKRPYGEQ